MSKKTNETLSWLSPNKTQGVGRGKERKRAVSSKYNVCNFYRFIRVNSGIRERRKRGEEKGGEARAILGKRKEKKRKREKRLSGRRKYP